MPEKTFVALTGNPGSGKSTIADHLETEYGFTTVRISSVIREYAAAKNIELVGRNDYVTAHLAMAAEHGEGYDIQRMFESENDRICIDGIRIVRQVDELHKVGAHLIALWCPLEERFARSLLRADSKDKPTLEGFRADETSEYQSAEPPYPSVLSVMQMADLHIATDRPQAMVIRQIDTFVSPLIQ